MMNSKTQITDRGLYQLLEESKKGIIVQILSGEQLPDTKPGALTLKFK